jgi:hypothetical protein
MSHIKQANKKSQLAFDNLVKKKYKFLASFKKTHYFNLIDDDANFTER